MVLEKEERSAIKMMAGYYCLEPRQRLLCVAASMLMAHHQDEFGLGQDESIEAVSVALKAQELCRERESLLGRWEEAYV